MKFKVGNKVLYENEKYIVAVVYGDGYRITGDEGYSRWACENELELIKPTIYDLRDYMLEHFVDNSGNLDVCGLDFSNFEGSIYITGMKCSGNLNQSGHKVKGNLYQSGHKVKGNLYQTGHKVNGDLQQCDHEVDGDLSQNYINVKKDYDCHNIKYGGKLNTNEPQKLLKEITKEELEEIGYKLKG